jgi:hypothetical protein
MPRGNRSLWIAVKVRNAKGFTRQQVIDRLIESVMSREYSLPRGWRVELQWRNRFSAPMRTGSWTTELQRSRRSSSGFDLAVVQYLENL